MALSTSLVDELHQPTISFSAVYIFLSITAFPGASLLLAINSWKLNFAVSSEKYPYCLWMFKNVIDTDIIKQTLC